MSAVIVIATPASTLLTLPLIVFHFEQLSIISPLANLFALPVQPGVMSSLCRYSSNRRLPASSTVIARK